MDTRSREASRATAAETRSAGGRAASRIVGLAVATALVTVAGVGAAAPAHAADVTLPNGCTIVGQPTPEVHTVCRDLTFGTHDVVEGADLSYADLTGSTIDGFLFAAAASQEHVGLVLDGATVNTLLSTQSSPVQVASARGATFTDHITFADFAGADLDGARFIPSGTSQLDMDFTGASMRGVLFRNQQGGSFVNLVLDDADLTDAELWNLAVNITAKGATFDGATFRVEGGVDGMVQSDLSGASLRGATLPPDLISVILDDVDATNATLPAGGRWVQVSAIDLELPGAIFDDFTINSTDLLRANLEEASVVDGSWVFFVSSNLTSANLRGADFGDALMPPGGSMGAVTSSWLPHADLTDARIPLGSSNFLSNAQAAGATFYVAMPSGGNVFNDAQLQGARFVGASDAGNFGGAGLPGASFLRAQLQDSVLDVAFNGSVFTDAVMDRATIHPSGLKQVQGTGFAGASMRDTVWPTNEPGGANQWLYSLELLGTDITGASFLPSDALLVSEGLRPVAAQLDLGAQLTAPDGSVPNGADWDADLWRGMRFEVLDAPSEFPIGETDVRVRLSFSYADSADAPVFLERSMFTETDPWAGTVSAYGLLDPVIDTRTVGPDATLAEVQAALSSTWDATPGSASAIVTAGDPRFYAEATVRVTVESSPVLEGDLGILVAGRPSAASVVAAAAPAATVTASGLPDGLSWDAAAGRVAGTPAAGSRGWHDVVLSGTNVHGADVLAQRVWVVELEAAVSSRKVDAGEAFTVSGEGFTPGGDVRVQLADGAELATVRALANGTIAPVAHTSIVGGRIDVQLVDVTSGAVVDAPPVQVAALQELAHTGASGGMGALALLALLAVLVGLGLARERRSKAATR